MLLELNGGLYQTTAEGADFGMSTDDLKIWFGILALVVVELGLITPPVGMNVFIISSLAKDVPMIETFKGVLPFFLKAELLRVTLPAGLPALTLWLPHRSSPVKRKRGAAKPAPPLSFWPKISQG